MPQPKSSPAERSMPTFATLEEWTRSQVQELMQSVLEEEVTHVLGRTRDDLRDGLFGGCFCGGVPSGGTVHRRRDHRSDHAMVGGMNFLAGHWQLDPSIRSNLLSSYGE